MLESELFYKKMEETFTAWANTVEDIRAAFMVGSRARTNHPADEWSDMDLVIYTSRPETYLASQDWLKNMGNLSTSFTSYTAGGDTECLTLFDGVWQVDFVIHSVKDLQYMVNNHVIPKNFYRGVKALVDKDHMAKEIMPEEFVPLKGMALTEELFLQTTNTFWFLALYVAKQILRNELWVAKARDNNMKDALLLMMEWHEKVIHGEDYDTWHAGRFLCEWASKDTLEELRHSFGHFDQGDSWRALLATNQLFARLAHEIAHRMDYEYPDTLEKTVTGWILQNGIE